LGVFSWFRAFAIIAYACFILHMTLFIREYRPGSLADEAWMQRAVTGLMHHAEATDPLGEIKMRPHLVQAEVVQLLRRLAIGQGVILIAEIDRAAVGLAVGIAPLPEEMDEFASGGRRYGFISDVFVDGKHRSQGIGAALVRQLEVRLGDLGCVAIGLTAYAFDERAMRFYERLGYLPRDITLMKFQ
jgi:GNAT superfamily N-acetyltransferase